MQRPVQKPWQFYFVMVFPNSAKITHDELKTMVESTYHIQEKEIAYLTNLAAKHPRNNLPKPVSPFIAVFMTFLRRTNGVSLLLLWLLVGAITYAKVATEYGMFLNAPVLAVMYTLAFLLGVTPFLGWKGAKTKSWVYLRYYDAGIICFLAFLGLGVAGLEYFQTDIGNALAVHEASTNRSIVQGTILFPTNVSSVDGSPHPVTNFIQAEADKAFVLFLQARFDAWFPQVVNATAANATFLATTSLMSLDPRPWLSRTFNVSAVFYPEPLKETPAWMTDFVATTCSNTSLVNDTLLTGFVPLPVQPTFHSCLGPILQFTVSTAHAVETVLLALAGLLVVQYGTLLVLKFVDPAASAADSSTKKAMRKTSSLMHFFDAVLFVLGLAFLAVTGIGVYMVLSRPDNMVVDTETQIIEGVAIGFCFVYGVLLCLSAALGCSPRLIRVQSVVLLLVVVLQLALATGMYVVRTDIVALASNEFNATTWDESLVETGLAHVIQKLERAAATSATATTTTSLNVLLHDFVDQECHALTSAPTTTAPTTTAPTTIAPTTIAPTTIAPTTTAPTTATVVAGTPTTTAVPANSTTSTAVHMATKFRPLNLPCRVRVVSKLAAFLGWVVNAAGVVVAIQAILLGRNLSTLVLLPRLRKLAGKQRKPKRTGGPPTVPYTDEGGAPTTKESTLPFHVAMDKYWESYPRGCANDATLAHARHQFTLEWLKVTGASSVFEKDALLTMSQFESIVRVLVLKRLVSKCGLEVGVNISRDGKHLYFKLTAPRKVVADEAEARKYKLQARNAVDPGLSFWTARQVAIENTVYDVHTAKQKLCALYGRHALTGIENQFFPNESMAQISRRINVHSREAMFADDVTAKTKKIPPPYRYTPYVPYYRKNAMQYLYKRHSTQLDLPTTDVAPSVFQVTDCMKLLHLVIHDELDTARMVANGLLEGYSCLHSASRFEWTNLISLSNAWLTYWRPRQLEGEPDPDKRYFANFFYRIYPFRQPLADVRAYFGEQIALYFLWLGFYAQCLLFPVVCSALYVVVRNGNFHSFDVDPSTGGVHLRDMGLGLVVLVWAFVYAKCWQRKNYMCAIAWGMHGIEDNEHDRADYYGTEEVNPITNEVERAFPAYMRVQLQATSAAAIAAIVLGFYTVVVSLFSLQPPLVAAAGPLWGTTLTSTLQVVFIQANALYTSKVAHYLNDRENYRTQSEYEHYLIMKTFGLQSLNHYSALLFVAFVKRTALGCADVHSHPSSGVIAHTTNCLPELENLLVVMFVWRVTSNVLGMVGPIAKLVFGSSVKPTDRYDLEYELSLDTYENTYEDYAEIVVQFGLFTLFIFPLPTSPIFAFLETAINLRMDAYKLCYCTRRPLPRNAQDIGAWFIYLGLLSRLCVATNLGVLFFTASNFERYSSQDRWTFYMLSVAVALVAYEALWFIVPIRPSNAATILERHDFLKQKYLFAYEKTAAGSAGDAIGATAHHQPSCQDMLDTLESYNADALTTLNTRVELLTRFNTLFAPKESVNDDDSMPQHAIELTNAGCAPTALTGIDAIREAVRRSTGLFDDDDTMSEWYFPPQQLPPTSPTANDHHHVHTHHSSRDATRAFVDDAEDEEYILHEDDEDVADVL